MVASNANFEADDPTLDALKRQFKEGVIRRYLVIQAPGGIRFGIFGVLGKEAVEFTSGAGAVTVDDFIESSKEVVKVLRDKKEKVDVVICLSHGGIEKGRTVVTATAMTSACQRQFRASTWSSVLTAMLTCMRQPSSTTVRLWSRPGNTGSISANW